jgi:putative ABC transport system permease protein
MLDLLKIYRKRQINMFKMAKVEEAARTAVRMYHSLIRLRTDECLQFIDLTDEVKSIIDKSGVSNGWVNIQTKHTTTAIIVNENEPLLQEDLKQLLEAVAPRAGEYQHNDFSRRVDIPPDEPANGHSHCKALFLPMSACVNIADGQIQLGRWQRIFLLELDEARSFSSSLEVIYHQWPGSASVSCVPRNLVKAVNSFQRYSLLSVGLMIMRHFISYYLDTAGLALQSIFAHKLRSFLTLIGIIIGVASVVIVGASISGFNSYVLTSVSKMLGVNHFMIDRYAHQGRMTEEQRERMWRRNKRLYIEDYEWLRDRCKSCAEVGAQYNTSINIKQNGRETFFTRIAGVTAAMASVEDKSFSDGRFFTTQEVDRAAYVCVIGAELREKFFDGRDPIGQTIKIRDAPMTIVGVEAKRGTFMGSSMDNHAYIPLTTFGKLFGRRQSLQIHGKARNQEAFQTTIEEARMVMRNRHKLIGNDDDDFGLVNTGEIRNQVDSFTGAIALVVTPITLLSLIVGGIVVMNIMLVSVTERTFEIGLRKAVGARRSQILVQFLIESSFLTAVGGLLGLLLASGLCWLIRVTTPIPMTITILYVLLSLAVSGGIGLIAGIYPAFKASRLDPVVALGKN